MAWIQPYFKDGDDGILAHSYVYQKNKKNKQTNKKPNNLLETSSNKNLILKERFNNTTGDRNSPAVSPPISIPQTFQCFYLFIH